MLIKCSRGPDLMMERQTLRSVVRISIMINWVLSGDLGGPKESTVGSASGGPDSTLRQNLENKLF